MSKPRLAASLIVIDRSGSEPRFLFGKRHEDLKFMPGKYVFPGGKLELADRRAQADGLNLADAARTAGASPFALRAQLGALALCALREALEEAGILIGASMDGERGGANGIGIFGDHGARPDLSPLRLIARAITPPNYPRRYDTVFFSAFRDQAYRELPGGGMDTELSGHVWASARETAGMPLPEITRMIVGEVTSRLAVDPAMNMDHPVPCFFTRRGKHIRALF